MATSTTFNDLLSNAAQVAAAGSTIPNARSSCYVTDKGSTRVDRGTSNIKRFGKKVARGLKKVFGKGKKPEVLEISAPLAFVDPIAFQQANDQSRPSNGTAVSFERMTKGLSVRNGSNPVTPVFTQTKGHKVVTIQHPPVTAILEAARPGTMSSTATSSVGISTSVLGSEAPSSATSSIFGMPELTPFPVKAIYEQNLKTSIKPTDTVNTRKAFVNKLDGHPTGPRATSVIMVPGFDPRETIQRRRSDGLPPRLPTPSPINPHITGFDDPRKSYHPGMFTQSLCAPNEIADAAGDDIQTGRDAAWAALNGATPAVVTAEDVPDAAEKPRPGARARPVTDTYLPDAPRGSVYLSYDDKFGRPFTVYAGTPRHSSEALGADRNSSSFFHSAPSTAPSSPGIPFTPDPRRHSEFFKKIENSFTFTPDLPIRPATPEPSPRPGSQEYLENVYTNPVPYIPTPEVEPIQTLAPAPAAAPAPVPCPQRDTLQVPKIPRKPVLSRTPKPAKAALDINKDLPEPPTPNSARRFTPATSRFPPRTDSLNQPITSFSRRPAYPAPNTASPSNTNPNTHSNPNIPTRIDMGENGHLIFNHRASAAWQATPAYLPRGPMNEMEFKERDQAVKREKSRKEAEAKAKAKQEKKAKKDEEAVKKLMCRNQ